MLFSFAFSMLVCLFSVLLYALRLFLYLYNRAAISFLEKSGLRHEAHVQDAEAAHEKEQLVSVLVSISHEDFIVPLLHAMRAQSYKHIEILVAISHAQAQQARFLKDTLTSLHREYIPHVPLMVFSGGKRAAHNVHVLAGAAQGECLCVLDQGTRLAPQGIALAMRALRAREVGMLSVIPQVLASSKFLLSYTAMLSIAFGMRRSLAYVPHSVNDVFSIMRAGDYYKYFLQEKGHSKYARDATVAQERSAEPVASLSLSHSSDISHAHVFSCKTSYHVTSMRACLQWFVSVFCRARPRTHERHTPDEARPLKRLGVFAALQYGTVGAWVYVALFITAHVLVLQGMFIDLRSYSITYALMGLISFATYYSYARFYGLSVYTAALQWFLSPIPFLHAFIVLSTRAACGIVRKLVALWGQRPHTPT